MDVVFPPLAFGPDGYSLTVDGRGSVPKLFRDMRIGSIYVEFLRLDSRDTPARLRNLLKNHAIIKVDFTSPYGNTEHDRYDGARIHLETKVEISDGPYQPGELFVKPARYPAASYSTARTCRIDLQANITLDHLLWVIESNNLQYFSFVVLNQKYYGCRDFVTQLVYQLYLQGYTTGRILDSVPVDPELPPGINNICQAIGYRYMSHPVGTPYVFPIERGHFDYYERIETPDMRYE
ncbi:hypothetical protein F4860DRAFT_509061 [Xylaria cubensis]|nr:hypothetical protein F4860DRAFT_509061 [Xylaria cubensis]